MRYYRRPRHTLALAAGVFAVLIVQSVALCHDQTLTQLKLNLVLQTLALLAFGLWSFRAGGSYLNAPMLFLSSIYIWHSTFLLGHYFNLAELFQYTNLAFTYGENFVYKASGLVGLCMSMAGFGSLIAYVRLRKRRAMKPTPRQRLQELCYGGLGARASQAARWLFAGMLLVLVLYLAIDGSTVLHEQYFDLYQAPETNGIGLLFARTQYFWIFVTILMIASHRNQPKALRNVLIVLLGMCIVMAMLGTRSLPFTCLTGIVVVFDCFVRRLRLTILAIFLVLLSGVSFIIDNARGSGLGLNVFSFSATNKDNVDFLYFFYQNGMIIRDVLRTMEFSQIDGPVYGKSLGDAALSAIPKPILNVFGYREPTVPSMWLVENSPDVPLDHGIGYSLVAEAYYNFGMWGCLLFALIGFGISTGYFRYIFFADIFAIVLTLDIAVLLMLQMRNDLSSYFRLIVYAALVLAFLKHDRRKSFELQLRAEPVIA